jgi:hypothetical protein
MTADYPESYHILWVAGRCHFIDDGTRKEIESRLSDNPGKCEHVTIDTIVGCEVTLVLYSVTSIESSTPESRRRDRELDAHVTAETGYEEE